MKFISEIGEIVDIGEYLFRFPSNFFQLRSSMKSHFRLRSLHFESCIPSSSFRSVEASSKRVRVSEGGVHDMREPVAGNQLNGADARQPATLAKQSVVRSALQLSEIAEQIVVVL